MIMIRNMGYLATIACVVKWRWWENSTHSLEVQAVCKPDLNLDNKKSGKTNLVKNKECSV